MELLKLSSNVNRCQPLAGGGGGGAGGGGGTHCGGSGGSNLDTWLAAAVAVGIGGRAWQMLPATSSSNIQILLLQSRHHMMWRALWAWQILPATSRSTIGSILLESNYIT